MVAIVESGTQHKNTVGWSVLLNLFAAGHSDNHVIQAACISRDTNSSSCTTGRYGYLCVVPLATTLSFC